jgi:hypothetical protein
MFIGNVASSIHYVCRQETMLLLYSLLFSTRFILSIPIKTRIIQAYIIQNRFFVCHGCHSVLKL